MARSFTSGSHYLKMSQTWADLDWFRAGAKGSVHVWVKLLSLGGDKTILAQFGAGGVGGLLMRTTGSSPNISLSVFHIAADTAGRDAITSGVFTAGVWTPVGFSWDATTMTSYINGGNTGTSSGARHDEILSPWTIGARSGGGNPFDGEIGEVSMFPGVVLTGAQFAALAKGVPAHEVEPRSLRHWKIHGNGTEYESGSQVRGGRAWEPVGTPAKTTTGQPPVGVTVGGQQRWITEISEDGSSLANWTAESGTWAINSGVIRATGGGRLLHNSTPSNHWLGEWESEMRILSAGIADLDRGGLLSKWDGAGNAGPACRMMWRTGSAERAEIENDSVTGRGGVDYPFSLDTWYRVMMQNAVYQQDMYIDDVFVVGSSAFTLNIPATRFALLNQQGTIEFRNARFRYLDPTSL